VKAPNLNSREDHKSGMKNRAGLLSPHSAVDCTGLVARRLFDGSEIAQIFVNEINTLPVHRINVSKMWWRRACRIRVIDVIQLA